MMKASGAIRMGSEGPPSLNTFVILTEFWKRLGMTREDIHNMPAPEFREFCTYIELVTQQEQAQARRQNSGR